MVKFFKKNGKHGKPVIYAIEEQDYYAATERQKGCWEDQAYLKQFGIASFLKENIERESINEKCFADAFELLVKKHESLRTIFFTRKGQLKFKVISFNPSDHFVLVKDLRDMPDREAYFSGYFDEVSINLSDLVRGPLLNISLFRLSDSNYIAYIFIHHIVADARSMEIITSDFLRFYTEAHGIRLNDNRVNASFQYKDFCAVQNIFFSKNEQKIIKEIKSKFAKVSSITTTLNVINANFSHKKAIPEQGKANLIEILNSRNGKLFTSVYPFDCNSLAIDTKTTPFAVLLSSLYLFLYRLTREPNILLASIVSNRYEKEMWNIIGNFTGEVYMYKNLDASLTVSEFIQESFSEYMEALNHVVFRSNFIGFPPREKYLIYFNYLDMGNDHPPQYPSHRAHSPVNCYHPVACHMTKYRDQLEFRWVYNADIFDEEQIEIFAAKHCDCLTSMSSNIHGVISREMNS